MRAWRILAVAGCVLAWLPLVFPVLLTLGLFVSRGIFRFDFLMPAELFLAAVTGGILLWIAAKKSGIREKYISRGLALSLLSLAGAQGMAMITGLASGTREPTGWPLATVLLMLFTYNLGLVITGIGGARLVRQFKSGA